MIHDRADASLLLLGKPEQTWESINLKSTFMFLLIKEGKHRCTRGKENCRPDQNEVL